MQPSSNPEKVAKSALERTENSRCVNLDWLEVYCLEPISTPLDADYFRSKMYHVEEREYGTRMYNEMFTLYGPDDWPLLEIRRNPKSAKEYGGIHDINGCHIRLVNRTCYFNNAAQILADFLELYSYQFVRIFRVDVCLDFEKFDSGDDPQKFIRRYMAGKYAKINQARITAHGEDRWDNRDFNSLSWGHHKSQIGTKLYNKTKELAEVHDKPYIRQAWFLSGLVDDPQRLVKRAPDGTLYSPQIYRLEFSIRSSVRNWFTIEVDGDFKKKQSYRNSLQMWNTREKLLGMFASLAQHYFHFKRYKEGQRKDRCDDKVLFIWKPNEPTYKVEHPAGQMTRDHDLERFLAKIKAYRDRQIDAKQKEAAETIIEQLTSELYAHDVTHPWDKAAVYALRQTIAIRMKNVGVDAPELISALTDLFDEHREQIF